VYQRAQELGWPIIFHSGAFALGPGRSDHALLMHFPEALSAFPRLTIVLGHMGFGDFEGCAAIARDHPNAMFDCCYVINGTEPSPSLSDDEAAAAIRKVGAERVGAFSVVNSVRAEAVAGREVSHDVGNWRLKFEIWSLKFGVWDLEFGI